MMGRFPVLHDICIYLEKFPLDWIVPSHVSHPVCGRWSTGRKWGEEKDDVQCTKSLQCKNMEVTSLH